MNTFWKLPRMLALALTFQINLCAATNEVPTFSGTVVDAQGNPVVGASVDYYGYAGRPGFVDLVAKQHGATDDRGAFEISALPGQGVVVVTKAGMAPGWLSLYSARTEPQKIVLSAAAALSGTVVDDAGQPVADVEVWVTSALNKNLNEVGQPNFLFGKIARGLFSGRTLADGSFRIENFPADGEASLGVKKSGKALRQNGKPLEYDKLPFHGGQEGITLTLEPAGSITGKVVVRGSGQPLASAAVSVMPSSPGIAYFSTLDAIFSDANGSFQIPDVPAGSYRVMANFTNEPVADWVADPVPITIGAGQAVRDVEMQAYKGGVVRVTVRGKKSHEPLADANVTMNSQDYSHGSSTDSNGAALFRLPTGRFNVFANKSDWSQAQGQASVTEGRTNEVTIELGEPLKVNGIVHNTSGEPVAGANVGVFPDYMNAGAAVLTDTNGRYTLSWQKPAWAGMQNQRFYLLVRHADLKLAAVQELEESTTNLDVTLKPAMSISAQVKDAKGKAITNVMAYLSLFQENSSFSISRRPVPSDGQGRIQAEALPLGERYGFYASAQGYGSGHQEMEAADPKADHYDFPPLILKLADRKLAGRVLDPKSQPAAGVQVWMNGEDQPNGNTTTDADGRFAFDAVCAGSISVSANGNGLAASVEAMGGDTNVVIRLDANNNFAAPAASLTLTGNVADPSGNHAAGTLVVVTPSWGPVNTVKTDANGDYSISWQPQPQMRDTKYFIIARDAERNLAAIEGIDTSSTNVSLRLEPGLSISGAVKDLKGAPLLRARVNLNILAGNMGGMVDYEPVKLDADGAFNIPALPMGQQYNVYVSSKGYGSAYKSISKNRSQTNSIVLSTFKLKTADRPLAGAVVDVHNEPVAGAQVSINGDGQPNDFKRTDENGKFKFTVCDGPIRIFAWSQSGSGRNNSANVEASGGDVNVIVKLGGHPRQTPVAARQDPLIPQPWTVSALLAWPADHKTAVIILGSLQAALLLGTGAGIFWFVRKRGVRV